MFQIGTPKITLPTLELNRTVLHAKLLKKCFNFLKIHIDEIFRWSNSNTVLAWIKKTLFQLKAFVRNRASIIHKLTKIGCLRY